MAKVKTSKQLSIIIPTINEGKTLPLLLADLNLYDSEFEVIVCDGGSSDLTTLIATISGAKVIKLSNANRGNQLYHGSLVAKGEWLLFVHADCRLRKKWVSKVNKVSRDSSFKNYAWFFEFKIKEKGIPWFLLQLTVFLRSHLLKRPYGDQGLLISRELYFKIGGYKRIPIMEDLEIILRLCKKNLLKCLGVGIETSIRKYNNQNFIQVAIKNAALRKQWREGADIKKLAKNYYLKH